MKGVRPVIGVKEGYDLWSRCYDTEANVLILLEKIYQNQRNRIVDQFIVNRQAALDLGCGSGRHIPDLEKRFDTVYGLDLSREMLERAEKKKTKPTTSFICADFLKSDTSRQFDFINCSLALMHFRQIRPFFSKVFDALKPSGTLYLVDAPDTFLRSGFPPHIHEAGSKLVVSHERHSLPEVASAIESVKLKILEMGKIPFDSCLLKVQPDFKRFQGVDCLYYVVAARREGRE